MMKERNPDMLPKLSYVLLAYNREQHIRAALESAFAQDYEGELEYIISDDCSTDGTFDVIREMVAAYKGGRRVVVTQTPHNMHLAGNTSHAVQFVTSDWVVRADDDDVSLPNRCTLMARAIMDNPGAACFLAPLVNVGDAGCTMEYARRLVSDAAWRYEVHSIDEYADASKHSVLPFIAVKTYAAKIFREWGGLPLEAAYMDDETMAMRCLLVGDTVALHGPPAILYRRTGEEMSGASDGDASVAQIESKERKLVVFHERTSRGYEAVHRDLSRIRESIASQGGDAELLRRAGLMVEVSGRGLEHARLQRDWWQLSTWRRLRHTFRSARWGSPSWWVFSVGRCLPLPLYVRWYSAVKRLQRRR